MSKMSDLTLAVRTIEEILPDLSNEQLQEWSGILYTAYTKVEQEMNSTMMHTCDVCGAEEYGYRTELPSLWRQRGDIVICFNHEDSEILEEIQKSLDKDKAVATATKDDSLEELMAIL